MKRWREFSNTRCGKWFFVLPHDVRFRNGYADILTTGAKSDYVVVELKVSRGYERVQSLCWRQANALPDARSFFTHPMYLRICPTSRECR